MILADLSAIPGRTYPARRRTQNLVGGASPIQATHFALGNVTLEPNGGQVPWHNQDQEEVYFILEGGGTLVTGGKIVNPKPVPANRSAGPRGEKIEGGVTRHVSKGDLIIIPGRTPHWWSSLDGDLNYMIIRPDPEGRIKLK